MKRRIKFVRPMVAGLIITVLGCATGGSSHYFQFPFTDGEEQAPEKNWSDSLPRRVSALNGTPGGGLRVTLVSGPGADTDRIQMEWDAEGDLQDAPSTAVGGGPLPGEEVRVRSRISGEIYSVHYSGTGKHGRRAAVLFGSNRPGAGGKLTLSVLELKNKGLKAEIALERYARDVALSEDGRTAYLFGNGPLGQWLVAYHVISNGRRLELKHAWERGGAFHANFPSRLKVADDVAIVGFEKPPVHSVEEPTLYGFNSEGKVVWSLPVQTHTGGYLVETVRRDDGDWALFIVSDDGSLRAYQLKKSE